MKDKRKTVGRRKKGRGKELGRREKEEQRRREEGWKEREHYHMFSEIRNIIKDNEIGISWDIVPTLVFATAFVGGVLVGNPEMLDFSVREVAVLSVVLSFFLVGVVFSHDMKEILN